MPVGLILFGIILIIINILSISKEKKSFGSMVKYKMEDMTKVEIEVAQMRKDFAETITELQQEIVYLKEKLDKVNYVKKEEILLEEKEEKEEKGISFDNILKEDDVINEVNMANKTERIKSLIKEGYSDEEICEKLSLGKGEVLLVRGLFK